MVIAFPDVLFGLCALAAPVATPILIHHAVNLRRRRLADIGAVIAVAAAIDSCIVPSWWLIGFGMLAAGAVAAVVLLPAEPERARAWARFTAIAGASLVLAAVAAVAHFFVTISGAYV